MRFNLGYTWFYIAAAFVTITIKYTTFNNKFAAFFFTGFQGFIIKRNSVFINQRAYMIIFIERVADTQLLIGCCDFIFDAIVHLFVDDQPAGGGTSLSGGTYCTKHGAADSDIEVGMF